MALGLAGIGAGGARAANSLPVNCTAAGAVRYVTAGAGPVAWTLNGTGSCVGDMEGTYILNFTGTGTSGTFGACDGANPGPVQNLNLNITGTLTNTAGLGVKPFEVKWTAPATTFPVTTPFSVERAGSAIGGGTLFTRIFGQCPAAGSPVAQYYFSMTL
jgi:hypothetical protein